MFFREKNKKTAHFRAVGKGNILSEVVIATKAVCYYLTIKINKRIAIICNHERRLFKLSLMSCSVYNEFIEVLEFSIQ